ncbi:hypothetical protein [Oleiagrimonas sp. C23AA]|uniref:hypothetical protein n=1 Tax=Oleiagrimonas sp. C23AA TaxID=2719047 RepID=UPI0014241C44|nr:hypothetical protein [Oleiagrimonas sp. C23AA]NII12047.1 hypothetical protein [Oleiagrimonas sp. C23AA]
MRVRQAWRRHAGDPSGAVSTRAEGARHAALLADLPSLGVVLCQSRARADHQDLARWIAAEPGMPWPDHPWLRGVWQASEVSVQARVGPDGVREWLDFADETARVWLRVWLLPDSDYCAWDALLERHRMIVHRAEPSADTCLPRACLRERWNGLHGAPAALCRFAVRRLGGMQLLGLSPVAGGSRQTLAHVERVVRGHARAGEPAALWM